MLLWGLSQRNVESGVDARGGGTWQVGRQRCGDKPFHQLETEELTAICCTNWRI